MTAKCDCPGCRSRRAAQMRWHNKPEVKPVRLAKNAERLRKLRAQLKQEIAELPDAELDRRAAKWLEAQG